MKSDEEALRHEPDGLLARHGIFPRLIFVILAGTKLPVVICEALRRLLDLWWIVWLRDPETENILAVELVILVVHLFGLLVLRDKQLVVISARGMATPVPILRVFLRSHVGHLVHG